MAMALEGVRVLDASGPIGHYAGRLLADLGADVIKVEPVGGDVARSWAPFIPGIDAPEGGLQFLLLNANKRGVTLDLEQQQGREIFMALVKSADVVIDSLQPAESARLALDESALRSAKPDIIHASVTGWGLTGPRANWAYADIVGCAMSGVMQLAGTPDGPPEQLPDMQGYHCASIDAAAGVVAALLHHQVSGEGQRVEVSMQEALSMAQETAMMQADIIGTNRERGGSALGPLRRPGFGVHRAADGHVFLMALGTAGAGFSGLVEFMAEQGDAEDLTEDRFQAFIAETMSTNALLAAAQSGGDTAELEAILRHLDDVVRAFCAKHPKRFLYEEGQRRRILVGIVNSPADILESPQLEARNWFTDIEDQGRGLTLRYPGPPWQLQGTPASLRRPAPLLGEHNGEILTALGLADDDLAALSAAGVMSS